MIVLEYSLRCLVHDYLQEIARRDKQIITLAQQTSVTSLTPCEDLDVEPRTEQPTLSYMLPECDGKTNTFQRLKEESTLTDMEV